MTPKQKKYVFIYVPLAFIAGLFIWDKIEFNAAKAKRIFDTNNKIIIHKLKDVHIAATTIITDDAEEGEALSGKKLTHIQLSKDWSLAKIKSYYKKNGGKCSEHDWEGHVSLGCYLPIGRWIFQYSTNISYTPHSQHPNIILIDRVYVRAFPSL